MGGYSIKVGMRWVSGSWGDQEQQNKPTQRQDRGTEAVKEECAIAWKKAREEAIWSLRQGQEGCGMGLLACGELATDMWSIGCDVETLTAPCGQKHSCHVRKGQGSLMELWSPAQQQGWEQMGARLSTVRKKGFSKEFGHCISPSSGATTKYLNLGIYKGKRFKSPYKRLEVQHQERSSDQPLGRKTSWAASQNGREMA